MSKHEGSEAIRWDKETDVIVAGGGYSGLAAAVAASELGASVVLLEKEKDSLRPAGRDGRGFIGMFAVESSFQKKAGINLTRDWAFKYAVEHAHWRCNALLVRKIIDNSADLIDWLVRHGQGFKEVLTIIPDFPRVWHEFDNQSLEVLRVLTKCAKDKSVELLYRTRAKDLIINPDGTITGIKALTEEGTINIRGNAVILATGGAAHAGPEPGLHGSSTEDGFDMAKSAGAAIDYIEEYTYGFGVRKFLPPEFDQLSRVMEQPLLYVNRSGERVFDEGYAYQPEMINVAACQKDHTLIEIFDESTKNSLMTAGVKYLQHGTKFQKLTRLDEQIGEALRRGLIEKAPSITELAGRLNIGAANLEKTVAQYNQFCDKKHDDVFLKEPKYLEPVREPPFYAIVCNQNFGFSMAREGGVRINTGCQALDADNNIIPGLYAVGKDAAGMYGNIYPLQLSGVNLTFEIDTGKIAGENTAALK